MALLDDIKKYAEKYGDVPKDPYKRFTYLIKKLKLKDSDLVALKDKIRRLKKAEWDSLDLVIYLCPAATPRPRFSFKTKRMYVFNAHDNSMLFKEFLDYLNEDLGVICTPMKFYVKGYCPIPEQMNKIETVCAELGLGEVLSTPDFDNMVKTYADMMQKHLILNDSLITRSIIEKKYSIKPRIVVHIEYMKQFDSLYNKRKVEGWKYFKDLDDKPTIDVI